MELPINQIIQGDCLKILKELPDESIGCVITSPPYHGLRDYCTEGQIGLEKTREEYIEKMLLITAEIKRVMKPTATFWWNHGDSYGGSENESWNAPIEIRGKQYRKTCNIDQEYLGPPIKDKKLVAKCLNLQNFRLIIRMIDEQKFILRNTIIWHKPNCMPASVKDRFTVDYEPVFFFVKSKKYYFEPQYEPVKEISIKRLNRAVSNKNKWVNGADGQTPHNLSQPRPNRNTKIPANIAEKMGSPRARYKRYESSNAPHKFEGSDHLVSPFNPLLGRNKRTVWSIPTQPQKEAHFATFPEKLIEPMIKSGCPKNGIILDPFMGSGTTAFVARNLGRNYIGIELNGEYIKIAERRLQQHLLL